MSRLNLEPFMTHSRSPGLADADAEQNNEKGTRKPWSTYEHEILEIFYPRTSKEAILDTLRTRSWKEIVCETNGLGIKRYVKDDARRNGKY